MTSNRAKEIIRLAKDADGPGPWVDKIDRFLTEAEDMEVKAVWNDMSGDTCWLDALQVIAFQ